MSTKVCLVKAMVFPVVMCQGLASAGSRDILRMDDVSEWRKIEKEIRKERHGVTKLQWARPVLLYFPGGCSFRGVPHFWRFTSRTPLPRSSLSRVQGYPQDGRRWWMKKDRDKERMTRGDQASSVSKAPLLYFPQGFYTLSYTYSKVKNAESTQHSISNNLDRYQAPSCKSLIFCKSSSVPEACWYSMTFFW